MDDIDLDLIKFFHGLIIDEIGPECSSIHKESLKTIQRLRDDISGVYPYSSTTKCAYIYNYAPCASSTLYRHFKEMLAVNTFILRRIVIRQSFTVCCFGSGLCTDFLALTRVLESKLRDCCSNDGFGWNRIVVDFVIISTDSHWKPTMEKMTDKLLEHLKVSASMFVFCFSFVTIDSSLSLTDDVKKTLCQSDFVTFVNFLRNISSSEKATRLNLIKGAIELIQEGAVVFFLDSPSKEDSCGLAKILDEGPMIEIYGPFGYDVHRMRMLCRRECMKLFSKHYGWRCCSLESVNSVAAWYKGMSNKQNKPRTWS